MQANKRTIELTTGTNGVNAAVIPANFASPTAYTPSSSDIKGHLSGIDSALATVSLNGDIKHTSFSAANNTANQSITGFTFDTGTIRSFKALVSVAIDATADVFEQVEIKAIYNGTSWTMAQESIGDVSGVTFDITNAGQVRCSTPNSAGFVSCTLKFRAWVTLQ